MAKRRTTKLSDQIRQAIDDSGKSRYEIAQATGIDESSLAKFYNGHRGLSMDALDRIGEYLGLRVVISLCREMVVFVVGSLNLCG
jgi:transcriptional regulator with XRE-family HTH domain